MFLQRKNIVLVALLNVWSSTQHDGAIHYLVLVRNNTYKSETFYFYILNKPIKCNKKGGVIVFSCEQKSKYMFSRSERVAFGKIPL